jgi:hypothetical protein
LYHVTSIRKREEEKFTLHHAKINMKEEKYAKSYREMKMHMMRVGKM